MRNTRQPFQTDKPTFVRIPFNASGKSFLKGDEFPWQILQVPVQKVQALYKQGLVHHNDALEEKRKGVIGDGLADLTIEQLHGIVATINSKVQAKAATKTEYNKKKCAKSTIKDKQIGHIRRWRSLYGVMEQD